MCNFCILGTVLIIIEIESLYVIFFIPWTVQRAILISALRCRGNRGGIATTPHSRGGSFLLGFPGRPQSCMPAGPLNKRSSPCSYEMELNANARGSIGAPACDSNN